MTDKHHKRDEAYRLFVNGNTGLFMTAGGATGAYRGLALHGLSLTG